MKCTRGFCVYNTETLLKLREAVGPEIGANFDPSHLIWQGMDPVAVIRELGGDAIFHVHAKDTRLDKYNMAKNGALDTKSYADEAHRSWIFRQLSATATIWSIGRTSSALCALSAVTMPSASSMRIAS